MDAEKRPEDDTGDVERFVGLVRVFMAEPDREQSEGGQDRIEYKKKSQRSQARFDIRLRHSEEVATDKSMGHQRIGEPQQHDNHRMENARDEMVAACGDAEVGEGKTV